MKLIDGYVYAGTALLETGDAYWAAPLVVLAGTILLASAAIAVPGLLLYKLLS